GRPAGAVGAARRGFRPAPLHRAGARRRADRRDPADSAARGVRAGLRPGGGCATLCVMPNSSLLAIRLPAALVLAATLAACATAGPGSLDETVTLGAAAPVQVGRVPLSLQLVAVRDQRCPADV